MIRTIPLNKLMPSTGNVRRTADERADRELKADIEARGLLQNLVVSPARRRGRFAVEAGERRRRALWALAEEGKLPRDHEVCCLVVDGGAAAQEASLAENFQRLAMNPADECLAFRQLIEQGADVEGVARRFGLTMRFVEGRLRLAQLAPEIFEALGAGEISLDVAKAYAATPDRERQSWVFGQVGRSYAGNHPDSIRRLMTQATASAGDRRALFVGEDAYLAAGGRIERDLFSSDECARWLDVALLERLALEKLEALAAQAAAEAGLAFVRPTLDRWIGPDQTDGLRRLQLDPVPLTDEEKARVDRLDSEIEELVLQLEDEELGDASRKQTKSSILDLSDEMDSIVNKPPALGDELKPKAGTFLMLDERGRPKLDSRYYVEAGDDSEDEGESGDAPVPDAADAAPKRPGLSRRLVDELAIQRRDILAVHVAADAGFALDLAIFLMAERHACRPDSKSGSSLVAGAPPDPVFGFECPDAPATAAREQALVSLDRGWADAGCRADRFDAFRSLPEAARMAWLGHCVALTLEASANVPGERCCMFHDHLGSLLGIDVARWWRPTGANYFDRVAKSIALEALEEVGGQALAGQFAKAKKAELAQECERIFAGNFIAGPEVKEAALAWVPEAMRFATKRDGPAGAAEGEAGQCDVAGPAGDEEEKMTEPVGQAA